jgi:hypothetical protein
LLSDLSGEEFTDARDSGDVTKELRIVRAAHHLLLLVDGEKIANPRFRQQGRDEACLLLRTFVEEGLLGGGSRVDVLFTKWDIAGSPHIAAVTGPFADSIVTDIKGQYGKLLGGIRSFRVTARDPSGALQPATGLEQALAGWVELGAESVSALPLKLVERTTTTEYDRFFRREMPNLFAKGTP